MSGVVSVSSLCSLLSWSMLWSTMLLGKCSPSLEEYSSDNCVCRADSQRAAREMAEKEREFEMSAICSDPVSSPMMLDLSDTMVS